MIGYIRSFPREKLLGVASLVASSIVNVVAGVLISHFIAKLISPEDYGAYYYVINLIVSACVFFSFGAFYTASRLLLLTSDDLSARRVHGVAFFCLILLSAFISALTLLVAVSDFGLLDATTRELMLLAPLGVMVTLFNSYFETVLPAGNRVDLIAKSRLYPKVFYFLVVFGVYFFELVWWGTAFGLLLSYFLSSLLFYIYLSRGIRPVFKGGGGVKLFFQEGRSYGFHVYLGSIFSVGGTALTGVAVGYLGDSRADVGYYALATSLCAPLSILPAALVTVSFRSFKEGASLSKKLVLATVAVSFFSASALSAVSELIVSFLWGSEYFRVTEYVYLLAAALVLYSVSDLVNRFLAAKGHGRALRNSSFVVGAVLIFSTVFLVNLFGGVGAAYARILAGGAYLLCMVVYYREKILCVETNGESK